ncbi:MAG TPA: TonB family protein [Thermoanaerobaculia bacterium]|nr:TonB family protein [Thermoanaerobaculia bacterium]
MASKSRPYEQFGTFILFKRLEADALGDLWRAGKVDGGQLAGTVALRRLSGGNRETLAQSAAEAREIVPMLSGTSFVRSQSIGTVDGIPYIAYEYTGGRSLRYIVDRARGGTNQHPNPIPLDQAIVVAEKVALSLATTGDLKYGDKRLMHGALLPQFIWISDDGEIRVAGQQLGRGIIASLRDPRAASEISRYIAPEIRASGEPTKSSEVYSMGAILYLLVSGEEPPDSLTASAFMQAVRGAKTMAGPEMPPEIRAILEKSLHLDPAMRYPSMTEMKQALSAVAHGGKYSATTFNLAFYLSNLLKKEMEAEAIDREKESKVNAAAYAEHPAAAAPAPMPAIATPMFGVGEEEPKKKNYAMLIAAAAVVLVAGGIGALVMTRSGSKPATPPPAAPPPVKAAMSAPAPVVVSQPVVASTSTSTTAAADPEAQKKAFEAAVNQKLQEEMLKLQKDYTRQLKQQQSKNAPVTTEAATPQQQRPQPAAERGAPSAAALDERRLEQKQAPAPTPQPVTTQQSAPQQVAQLQTQQQQAPPPVATVREGDVVEFDELDAPVSPLSPIRPAYPAMAARAKASAQILLTTLIDENGRVVEVKILRGDPRFGFNDEAIRAIRTVRFSTPTKNGKRVKTWRPQTISFAL